MPKNDDQSCQKNSDDRSINSTDHSSLVTNNLPTVKNAFDRMAGELFERCMQNDWPSVLKIALKMTHTSLGFGYFALAGTLKKLYWSLVPHLDETRARKYVSRVIWSLARAKRENDDRFLIHRDPDRFKLRKHGETVIRLVKVHNYDPDLVMPARHEWEAVIPNVAPLIVAQQGQSGEELHGIPPCHTNHHAVMQSPHIALINATNTVEP